MIDRCKRSPDSAAKWAVGHHPEIARALASLAAASCLFAAGRCGNGSGLLALPHRRSGTAMHSTSTSLSATALVISFQKPLQRSSLLVLALLAVAGACSPAAPSEQGQAAQGPAGKEDPQFPRLPSNLQVPGCDVCGQMALIPAVTCMVGSDPDELGRWEGREEPKHEVHVPAFALGRTEVTQGQWKALMGDVNPDVDKGFVASSLTAIRHLWGYRKPYNPSHFKDCGDACPVESVSWDDAQIFIQRLNAQSGEEYRLPTDAEWECAARAGGTGRFGGSDDMDGRRANYNTAIAYDGKPTAPSRERTVRADSFEPNAFGLYNTAGNVWEWAQDCWNPSHEGAPTDGSARLTGDCTQRSLRGGSWIDDARRLRPAQRSKDKSDVRLFFQGFRLARTIR